MMNVFNLPKEFVQTLIRDTIETYPAAWRLVHEAVQNAHDGITRNDKIDKGIIEINLFVGSNKVHIKDNGCGIPASKFASIFQLGGGDKNQASEMRQILKGSQGVGIKSTCFTSKVFSITTVNSGRKWGYVANDFHKFGEVGFDGQLTDPIPEETDESDGTSVEYSLNDYSVEDFLNEVTSEYLDDTQEETINSEDDFKRLIENYFRMKTYLGCVQRLLGVHASLKDIEVRVNVYFDAASLEMHMRMNIQGCEFLSSSQYFQKSIVHLFPGTYIDALEIYKRLPRPEKADRLFTDFVEVLRNPADANQKKVLIQKFDKEQAKKLLSRVRIHPDTGGIELEEDTAMTRKHKNLLNILNGVYIIIAQRPYMGKYFKIGPRQLLSVNGLPTSIALSTPRGALAYLNNIHMVLDVNATLGFGKRNIPSRTKGNIDAFFADVWSMLRRVTPTIVGAREGRDPTTLPVWNEEEQYDAYQDQSNMLKELPLFFRTTPKEEQEVVALFFELIGRKLLKGFFPFRVGANRQTYDALFYISLEESERMPKSFRARELKTIEFKFNLSEIIADFEEEYKFLEDIDLVVCWNNDCVEDTIDYNVSSLQRDNITPLPGAQLRIHKGTRSCQVLVLKDFIASLEFSS